MSERFDVIIVGAGVTGIGTALALADLGKRCVIVDSKDLLGEASSNSLRIVHGGLRYLQSLDVLRSLNSAFDQEKVLRSFPGAVEPLRCVLPLSAHGFKSRFPARIAATLYTLILRGVHSSLPAPRTLEIEEQEAPLLRALSPYGVMEWWDAQIRDPSLFAQQLESLLTERGVRVLTDTLVSDCQVSGSTVSCVVGGTSVEAGALVNATGAGLARDLSPDIPRINRSSWMQAWNLIFKKNEQLGAALAQSGGGGRMFFASPRSESLAVGTWYADVEKEFDLAELSESTIHRSVGEAIETFKGIGLREEDFEGIEFGVLAGKTKGTLLSRPKVLQRGRYFEVLAPKLTTFFSVGQKAARKIARIL